MKCKVAFDCGAFDFPCLCQLNDLVKILGKKWTTEIITTIGYFEDIHFTEIQSKISHISPNVLSERLLQLLEFGMIERNINVNITQENNYRLSEKGKKIWNNLIIFIRDISI